MKIFFIKIYNNNIFIFKKTFWIKIYEDEDYNKKRFIILGNEGVGKTSILNSLLGKGFNSEIPSTLATELFSKKLEININGKSKDIIFDVFDTSGKEKFRTILKIFMKNKDGIILVYSINDRKSFENISKVWIPFISEFYDDIKNIPIFLISNKNDLYLEEQVSYEESFELANNYNMKFFEFSAKIIDNNKFDLQEIIKQLPQKEIENYRTILLKEENEEDPDRIKIVLTDEEKRIQKAVRLDPVANCAFSFGVAYSRVLEKELKRKKRKCIIW